MMAGPLEVAEVLACANGWSVRPIRGGRRDPGRLALTFPSAMLAAEKIARARMGPGAKALTFYAGPGRYVVSAVPGAPRRRA